MKGCAGAGKYRNRTQYFQPSTKYVNCGGNVLLWPHQQYLIKYAWEGVNFGGKCVFFIIIIIISVLIIVLVFRALLIDVKVNSGFCTERKNS